MLNVGKTISYITKGIKVVGAAAIITSVYMNRKN